jgi:hypothetical protein
MPAWMRWSPNMIERVHLCWAQPCPTSIRLA